MDPLYPATSLFSLPFPPPPSFYPADGESLRHGVICHSHHSRRSFLRLIPPPLPRPRPSTALTLPRQMKKKRGGKTAAPSFAPLLPFAPRNFNPCNIRSLPYPNRFESGGLRLLFTRQQNRVFFFLLFFFVFGRSSHKCNCSFVANSRRDIFRDC